MTLLRVVVADDEPIIRRDLVRLLRAEPAVEVAGEARNGIDALALADTLRPDALFLDVQMPELDGIGVVSELDPATAPAIVFVTAFDHYALQAFDANAVDYLLKPFDRPRLQRAVTRVRDRLARNATVDDLARAVAALHAGRHSAAPQYLSRIAARGTGRTALLDVGNIRWIAAADNYVRLYTSRGDHLSRRTMADLELQLDPVHFARIHRSTIVNLQCVRTLQPIGDGDYHVALDGGAVVRLSRSYREAFEARFGGLV